jgi:flagellin-like protein
MRSVRPGARPPHGGLPARSRLNRRGRSRRAVSEVVATIILLALTVVLFSAIFAFVTSFPAPPAQSNNQFQASLIYGTASGKTVVTQLKIIHLAGPAVAPTALIYVKSAANPSGAEFQNPYNMTDGGIAKNAPWNLGQTWIYSFPSGDQPGTPDNLTIYVVSSASVLFSVILPGQSFPVPPTFVATGVSPTPLPISTAFNVTTTLSGSVKTDSVFVNLGGIPGCSATPVQLKYAAATGQYYNDSSGCATTVGTYYAFLNATGTTGQTATTALAITFSSSSSSPGVALALAPVQGVAKASMTASGSGFQDAVSVTLTFNAATITMTSCSVGTLSGAKTSVTTSSSGTFSCTFVIPSDAAATYSVTAASSTQSGTALFTVTALGITTSATTVAPGSALTVSGTGFSVSSTVAIYYKDGSTNTTMGTSTNPCTSGSLITTGSGTFSCTFTVPSTDSSSGSSTLSIEDISSGAWVTKTITN